MAGTVTVEESAFEGVCKVKFTWTSSAGGAADLSSVYSYFGIALALVTVPAGGGAAPTDNYGVTMKDVEGYDVMQAAGLLRDTANTESAVPTTTSPAFGKITLGVTAAGAAKGGTATLYILGKRQPA